MIFGLVPYRQLGVNQLPPAAGLFTGQSDISFTQCHASQVASDNFFPHLRHGSTSPSLEEVAHEARSLNSYYLQRYTHFRGRTQCALTVGATGGWSRTFLLSFGKPDIDPLSAFVLWGHQIGVKQIDVKHFEWTFLSRPMDVPPSGIHLYHNGQCGG